MEEMEVMATGTFMTRAEIPSIQILGRPFKPLAVGLILATGTMGLNALLQLLHQGTVVATPSSLPPILGLLAVASVVLMVTAWVIRSQRIYEIGLVLSVGAWAFRGFGLLLDGGGLGFMFPISMMVMAAGAFLLERADERAGMD
jgi:hypothetical protein